MLPSHVSQLGWDLYAGMQCFPFSKQNSFYLKQKLYFRLILTLSIVQTALWFVSVIFNKMQMGSSVLFGEQGVLFAALPYILFVVQFSPDGGLMKMNISQSDRRLLLYPGFLLHTCSWIDYCWLTNYVKPDGILNYSLGTLLGIADI